MFRIILELIFSNFSENFYPRTKLSENFCPTVELIIFEDIILVDSQNFASKLFMKKIVRLWTTHKNFYCMQLTHVDKMGDQFK